MSDLFIGSNRINAGFSWIKIHEIPFVSENSVSYYIHDILDEKSSISLIVMKDTDEGKKISKSIEYFVGKSLLKDELHSIFDEIYLKHANPKMIRRDIERFKLEAYRKGRADKANEIRTVLNSN